MAHMFSGGLCRLVLVFSAAFLLAAPAHAQAPADPDTVVATVNGEKLTQREVDTALQEMAPPGTTLDDARREQLVGFLINIKLAAAAAREEKLDQGGEFEAKMTFLREKALMEAYLEKAGKQAVTDEAIKKIYEESTKDVTAEDEVRARHVLVETEDEAKAVVERLNKGEDFAAVAKELSQDPGSGADGGDLGFFLKGQMVPEFAEAAFKMEPGKVSEPVKSQYGWHIIKVEERRPRAVPKLEEVRAQIEDFVEKRGQEEAVKKLVDAAKIERPGQKPAEPAK